MRFGFAQFGFAQLGFSLMTLVAVVCTAPIAHAQQTDEKERLLELDVSTNVPFVSYKAEITVAVAPNGDLDSVTVTGNVPGMQTTYASYQQFVAQGGYHMSGARGDAFGMTFNGPFDQSSGGNLNVYALMCSGRRQNALIHLERQGREWEVEENNRRIMKIQLEAHVGLSGWEGCFDSMSGS